MGCFGCGCAILLVLLFLLLGLAGGLGYFSYRYLLGVTSTAPAEIPAFNGSDDIYTGAQKKIDAFNQDVNNAKASTLTLSSDEINSLIAHDPTLARLHVRALVTMTGDEARLQGTLPTDAFPFGMLKGRYFNLDATFALTFNSDTKVVGLDLHKVMVGETQVPENSLPSLQAELTPGLNAQLQKIPATRNALEVAKTVAVKDGQLVIETK